MLDQIVTYYRQRDQFDIFIVPTGEQHAQGIAWISETGRKFITLEACDDDAENCFVLLHEVAHHVFENGGLVRWTSEPSWIVEKRCDAFAMSVLAGVFPEHVEHFTYLSKLHVRRHMQPYIDHDIWNHVDLDVADWAGCNVPLEMRLQLATTKHEPVTTRNLITEF